MSRSFDQSDAGFNTPEDLNSNALREQALTPSDVPSSPASVDRSQEGQVRGIKRSDGSSTQFIYHGQLLTEVINHTRTGGTTDWKRDPDSDTWHSMDLLGATRLHYQVDNAGNVSFDFPDGTQNTIYGDNSELVVHSDRSSVLLDRSDKVLGTRRPNGSALDFYYQNNELDRVTEHQGGTSLDWHRQSDGTWRAAGTNEIRHGMSVSQSGNLGYIGEAPDSATVQYIDGNKRTFTWDKGHVSQVDEYTPNGVISWHRIGNSDDWKSGQTKERRFDVDVSRNGDYSYIDSSGNVRLFPLDDTERQLPAGRIHHTQADARSHDKLIAAGRKTIADPTQEAKFENDVNSFEQRAAAHGHGLTVNQVVQTELGLSELLSPPWKRTTISYSNRVDLAKEALHHIAMPRGIDQGAHNTCGATAPEVVVAARHPERYVDLIRQVAERGKYVSASGLHIKLDSSSLQPDWQARDFGINPYNPKLSERSFASQIYQVTGINTAYAALHEGRTFEQHAPQNATDEGEVNRDNKTGQLSKFTGLTAEESEAIIRETSGEQLPFLQQGQQFDTASQLTNQIRHLQSHGKLPVPVRVNENAQPFQDDSGNGPGNGPSGHVTSIWGIDGKNRVLLDNQWGRDNDHESLRRLPVSKLFDATKFD